MARKHIVPQKGDPILHLISRCVRQAFLCGESADLESCAHRKVWIENRLAQLTQWFAVEILTYAFMSNHFHLVVQIKRSTGASLTDEQVVRRWVEIFPRKSFFGKNGQMVKENHIQETLESKERVAELRLRLSDSGWFMKALKEPISRMANQEDKAKGAFWDARYKSVSLQDEAVAVACMLYVDLNPLRAGLADTVEAQVDVGIADRIAERQQKFKGFREQREKLRLQGVEEGGADVFKPVARMQERSWLKPMDGPFLGKDHILTLEGYLSLLEITAQSHRTGKAQLTEENTGTLQRLGLPTKQEAWERLMRKLGPKGRCLKVKLAA